MAPRVLYPRAPNANAPAPGAVSRTGFAGTARVRERIRHHHASAGVRGPSPGTRAPLGRGTLTGAGRGGATVNEAMPAAALSGHRLLLAARPGETRKAYEYVESIYFPIAIGVFAAIVSITALFLVLGWRRKQAGERHEANLLEGTYAICLACVVAFLVYVTFSTESPEDQRVANPGVRIRVIAARWTWRFVYPNGATIVANSTWQPPLAPVPTGTEVEFAGTSQDVIHGFWVPEQRYMRQVIPGYVTRFDLVFHHAGVMMGVCSVYCGDQHERMHFALRAISPAAFREWLTANARKVIT